jgi:NAD(P)-dependent dehydrogenase (short-subunit alcohol dehydrogenase family)
MLIIRAAIPYLRKSPAASVVNISSVAGRRPFPGMAAYSAAKAGLIMLTQQAAMDYGAENIRFNAVCPGWVRTAARMQGSAQWQRVCLTSKPAVRPRRAAHDARSHASDPS